MARARVPGFVWALPVYGFLLFFIVFPLWRLFQDAVTTEEGAFTFAFIHDFLTDGFYHRALLNSLLVAIDEASAGL